ncbi:antibiotic biosynthesis monooxygenase family protein [Alicyclobacillus suci]|uniref:antibiotic biosynthesis monooxygenase family protein n=1 Tax=Alicyclobacillus suci TaxID=2816080 RepID=UPI001CB78C05|nr:antibiotic biosynthesis monooxygenase [Alicyclobacillus suci]
MQASFEIEKAFEERLRDKMERNRAEIVEAEGLQSVEYWRTEHKDTIEYAFVSKWASNEHFKRWISREEHVNEHRTMQANRNQNDGPKMKKTLRSYEVLA